MAKKPAKSEAEPGGFRGFGSQALPFLLALRENNDRTWFAENKATYVEECEAPFRELVLAVGRSLEAKGSPMAPRAKNPAYRIYRDVRFSKDKTPYKTHLGASLHREGDKSHPGLVYLHVEPGHSFLAAGFHQPDPPLLKALRSAIADDPEGFAGVLRSLAAKKLELGGGEPLARMPKGFEAFADSPHAATLRNRSFLTSRRIEDDDLERRDLPEVVARFALEAAPLLEFAWARAGD